MRPETEVSSHGYDTAKAADDAYQWLAYGWPQGSGRYEVPLRDRASRQWQAPQPQLLAAIPGQRPGATPAHLAPVPRPAAARTGDGRSADRRTADRRLALAVALVFLALFCLVGAWWWHTATAARHAPGPGTTSAAVTGQ